MKLSIVKSFWYHGSGVGAPKTEFSTWIFCASASAFYRKVMDCNIDNIGKFWIATLKYRKVVGCELKKRSKEAHLQPKTRWKPTLWVPNRPFRETTWSGSQTLCSDWSCTPIKNIFWKTILKKTWGCERDWELGEEGFTENVPLFRRADVLLLTNMNFDFEIRIWKLNFENWKGEPTL